ncbi:outer membrane protein assembly factor BamB [Acinetobacter qingfengensis]|uniref:Outer membrane protein assembly factor BamB n=1 Tax=Acinetobacter qingfengensis TaxID=1262585 RepID=A0A1E7R1E0_9GAMM|nr:outer membrane protein assembly factor BamB [Acinetobacter qingfengensis]KAA8733263.1 outer membrane protein assembly factor BamB [Acinetobacter qingfengensis]OEY93104.1 outer membrane protein assembly factor BamB [Acinetobacter qingfengensis]
MKKVFKVPFVLTVLSVALLGCASKGKKAEEIKPNPLPKIQATQSIAQVFSTSGKDSPKFDPLRFQLEQANGTYYSADVEGTVQAIKDGKTLWKKRPVKQLSAGTSFGQGAVVIGSPKGDLIALDADTGETLWQQQLPGSILSPSLIVNNRVITISNDGTVYANDIQTGQQLWTFNLPETALSMRGYAAPVMLDARTVGIATADAYVYAVDSITGVPVWQRRVAVSEGRGDIQRLVDIDSQPQVVGSNLVTVSFQGQVTVTDLTSQRVVWSENASSLNSPAVDQQAVYVATTDGHLVAYNLQTGQKLWDNDQLLNRKLSNPVILGNVLVVGDYDGILHLIDPANGQITGRAQTRGDIRTLRVEDNLLYVSTTKGNFSVWQNR